MENIHEYLSYFDIFGYDLTFRHNKFIKYRTIYGGLITIICTGFLIFAFLNLAQDCFKKINPVVRESSYYEDYTIIDANKFFFSFYFTDEKFNYIPDIKKYLIFHGVVTNYTDSSISKTVGFSQCNYEKHFKNTELPKDLIYDKMKFFDKSYCLDLDNDFKLINSGIEIPRLSLSIYVIECRNSTIDEVEYIDQCARKTEIDPILKSFMVNSYFFNSFIVTDDIIDPNRVNIKKESLIVSNNHSCDKLFITYKNSSVSMDSGFIFQEPNLSGNIKISNYVPDQVPNTRELLGYNIIYDVEIDADHFRSITYIKFMKIQEALATMGGIISILKIFFSLILMGIYKFGFSFLLFREVYLNGNDKIKIDPVLTKKNFLDFKNINIKNNFDIKIQNMKISNNHESADNLNKKNNLMNLEKVIENNRNFVHEIMAHTDNHEINRGDEVDLHSFGNKINSNVYNKIVRMNNIKNNIFGVSNFNINNNKPNPKEENFNYFKFSHTKLNAFIELEKNCDETNQENKMNVYKNNEKNRQFNDEKIEELQNFNNKDNEFSKSSKRFLIDQINNKQMNKIDILMNSKLKKNEKNYNFSIEENQVLNKNNKIFPKNENNKVEIENNSIKFNQNNKLNIVNNSVFFKNHKDQIKRKSEKISFKISLLNLIYSIFCRKKNIYEPLEIILEKIDKEMEIQKYLRLKEDILIIKELLFEQDDIDIFDDPYDFEEIYYSLKCKNNNFIDEGIGEFLRKSFGFAIKNNKNKKSNNNKRFSRKFTSIGEYLKKK